MTKSRIALALIFAAPAPAVAGQIEGAGEPVTAETAIAIQRRQVVEGAGIDCRASADDIVVCGRRDLDRDRATLAAQRLPGDRVALDPGEASSGLQAMSAGTRSCAESRQCGAFIDFVKAGTVLLKIGKQILDPDD
jgi:hypothetical protein